LVVTPEGALPIGYEVFDGNRADVTTVEEMVELMERKYGKAKRIWVMDRGMVSEDNLDFLREREARYLVGTPKGQLRRFEQQLLEEENWAEVQPGVEVKLVEHPDGKGAEQYVICRSRDRQKKEAAMLEQKRARLLAKLKEIDASLRKRPQKIEPAAKRVGRWLGRYAAAERVYEVEILRDESGEKAVGLRIEDKDVLLTWAQLSHGAYLLRTNCTEQDAARIWKWYIQLTQAEECFRISKSDLQLRPVFHQKTERVEAHILVCFLTLALWRTLEMWMRGKDLGNCSRQLLKEVATVRSMDVVLPVRDGAELRLRVVGRPDRQVAALLTRLGLELPGVPKRIENVVEKIGP
jgi:transposase